MAVCLLPGTEVAFETGIEYERGWVAFRHKKVAEKVARFRQVDMKDLRVHHDALEFPDGQIVLVNDLCEGQHLTVLQLPASLSATNKAAEHIPEFGTA